MEEEGEEGEGRGWDVEEEDEEGEGRGWDVKEEGEGERKREGRRARQEKAGEGGG